MPVVQSQTIPTKGKEMSIRVWAFGLFVLACAQPAIGQDYSPYVSCNDTVLATTSQQAFLPGTPTYTMRISPLQSDASIVASGATAQFWRVPCPGGGSSVTGVRIVPDALQPPSDALRLRYFIFQGNAPRTEATLYSYLSDVFGPTTGTLQFPPLSVSSPLPLLIDGDPDGAFTIEAYDASDNLRGLINIPAASAGTLGFVPQVGLWWNPTEPGSGYSIDIKHGILVVTVYSYTTTGDPIWYLAAGPLINNFFTATIDKYRDGPCISCSYKPYAINGNDGTIAIAFTSPTTATVTLPAGRSIQIVPQAF